MDARRTAWLLVIVTVVLAAGGLPRLRAGARVSAPSKTRMPADDIPVFEFDPTWPRLPFPNQWIMGNVAGMASDEKDHIWVIQRPLSGNLSDDYAQLDPPAGECCRMFPSIIEFDQAGNVVTGTASHTSTSPNFHF